MVELVPKISVLLLIFVRVSAFFVTIPLFSYKTIPSQLKIVLAFVLSWMMYYTFSIEAFTINGDYLLLVLKEAVVGLVLGLVVYIVFSAV